jgi:hypothetical protein
MAYFAIVAKDVADDATYHNYPEQKAARARLADMNGVTFDTLDEADEYLDARGVKREEGWAYPQTGRAAPGATMIWFLRMQRPGYRIGHGFQLCKCSGIRPELRYTGTHPANMAGGLREIAKRVAKHSQRDAETLVTYAGDVERLAKAAGIKSR